MKQLTEKETEMERVRQDCELARLDCEKAREEHEQAKLECEQARQECRQVKENNSSLSSQLSGEYIYTVNVSSCFPQLTRRLPLCLDTREQLTVAEKKVDSFSAKTADLESQVSLMSADSSEQTVIIQQQLQDKERYSTHSVIVLYKIDNFLCISQVFSRQS